MFTFNCGDTVKDTITGFTGVVVARTEYFNGCLRYLVQPIKMKDGIPQQELSYDEQQLELVKKTKPKKVEKERTGGPMSPVKNLPTIKRL